MFNYQNCTIDELVEHVKCASRGAITQAKKYYLERGMTEVSDKIDKARKISSRDKVVEKAQRMSDALEGQA